MNIEQIKQLQRRISSNHVTEAQVVLPLFTCGEAISAERRRSTSRFFPPPSPSPIIKFWHIMPILGCTRTTQEYLVTSREIWLPGKFDFPEI